MGAVTATVSADGTLVVSEEELRRAGIGPGAVVRVTQQTRAEREAMLASPEFAAVLDRAREVFAGRPGVVDDLIAERRDEARRDEDR